jgi:hypothetical protein
VWRDIFCNSLSWDFLPEVDGNQYIPVAFSVKFEEIFLYYARKTLKLADCLWQFDFYCKFTLTLHKICRQKPFHSRYST